MFALEFFFLIWAWTGLNLVELESTFAGRLRDAAVARGFPELDLVGVLFAGKTVVGGLESRDKTTTSVVLHFVVVVAG